jgi:hypothetical protein
MNSSISSAGVSTTATRLVHRPTITPNNAFVGWGPKLGSI